MVDETNNSLFSQDVLDSMEAPHLFNQKHEGPVAVLGKTFYSDEERRAYFRDELRKKLPELKKIEGYPIGEDDDIIALSDPPYYTACPNPWLNDFVAEWEEEKKKLVTEGKRVEEKLVTEPYASDISEGKKNAVYGAHSYHTKVPHPAIMRYIMHFTQPGDIVLDGFSGTGMTGVASQMMESPEGQVRIAIDKEVNNTGSTPLWGKRNSICSDLSPLASFIAYNYTNYVDRKLFEKEYKAILSDLNKECGWMYQTRHTDGSMGTIDFVVWSEVFNCPNCGNEIVFFNEALDENGDVTKTIKCPHCGAEHVKKDLNRSQETHFDKNLNQIVTQSKYLPVHIQYFDNNGNEYTKVPDKEDLAIISKINDEDIASWYPTDAMMGIGAKWGDSWRAGYHNGITNVHHFYLRRSLKTLSYLYDRVSDCQPEWKAIFVSIITALSKQQRYRANSGFPNMILSGTLYIGSMIREWNPIAWFQGKVKGINRLLSLDYRLDNTVAIQTQSSTSIVLNDCSVDYIFTDPPFGDNLMYSELNFIAESWLKVKTNNREEAIESVSQEKGLPEYQDLMTRCFSEFYRVLKHGKWMTVEFSNTSSAVWNCIQNSLTKAGFVIASVAALDKKQGSYKALMSTVAVKEDLVISCYKPSSELVNSLGKDIAGNDTWEFIDDYLSHLPVHLEKGNATTTVIERSPKILYDRLITYFVQHGLPVPIDASDFQAGLRERYEECDGMFFTAIQYNEYLEKKRHAPEFVPMGLIIGNEADGIEWLRNRLRDKPQTYQQIQPDWLQAIGGLKRGDILPGLNELLEENFIQEPDGSWRLPNIQDDVDKERLRTKALLKEFKTYVDTASKPKAKIKEVRVEAIRAGFKQCYIDKNFATIVLVGDKIPQNLLAEDDILLQFYDIARTRI